MQTSPTSLAIPTPLCAHIFMGGWRHFWSDQVLWVRESNALIQERTFTPIIEQYCICTWFQFAGNFIIFVAMDTMGRGKEIDQRL